MSEIDNLFDVASLAASNIDLENISIKEDELEKTQSLDLNEIKKAEEELESASVINDKPIINNDIDENESLGNYIERLFKSHTLDDLAGADYFSKNINADFIDEAIQHGRVKDIEKSILSLNKIARNRIVNLDDTQQAGLDAMDIAYTKAQQQATQNKYELWMNPERMDDSDKTYFKREAFPFSIKPKMSEKELQSLAEKMYALHKEAGMVPNLDKFNSDQRLLFETSAKQDILNKLRKMNNGGLHGQLHASAYAFDNDAMKQEVLQKLTNNNDLQKSNLYTRLLKEQFAIEKEQLADVSTAIVKKADAIKPQNEDVLQLDEIIAQNDEHISDKVTTDKQTDNVEIETPTTDISDLVENNIINGIPIADEMVKNENGTKISENTTATVDTQPLENEKSVLEQNAVEQQDLPSIDDKSIEEEYNNLENKLKLVIQEDPYQVARWFDCDLENIANKEECQSMLTRDHICDNFLESSDFDSMADIKNEIINWHKTDEPVDETTPNIDKVATELDAFYQDVDTYDYADNYSDGQRDSVEEIKDSLKQGNVEPIKDALNLVKEESESDSEKERIDSLLNDIDKVNIDNKTEVDSVVFEKQAPVITTSEETSTLPSYDAVGNKISDNPITEEHVVATEIYTKIQDTFENKKTSILQSWVGEQETELGHHVSTDEYYDTSQNWNNVLNECIKSIGATDIKTEQVDYRDITTGTTTLYDVWSFKYDDKDYELKRPHDTDLSSLHKADLISGMINKSVANTETQKLIRASEYVEAKEDIKTPGLDVVQSKIENTNIAPAPQMIIKKNSGMKMH